MNHAAKTVRPGLAAKLLHAWYSRGAAMRFFFARRFRPAGVGLIAIIVLAAGLGIGHPRIPVYQIFSLTIGMAVIAVPWAFARRASIRAERELPHYATAGETIRYSVHVTHTGSLPLRRAWLAETPADPRPDLLEFLQRREPGEEDRNWFDRKFAYYRWRWLLDRRRAFDSNSSADPLELDPGKSTRVACEITPLYRGVIRLNDLRVLLPDPFGLVQSCRKVTAPPATLTVLPKRHRLPSFEMPGGSRFQSGDEASTNSIGTNGEFLGLRDYRPGDPPRQIHWKSWARTGRPIVKELEDTYFPRYGLILDTFVDGSNEAFFEEAVSVAASFVAMIDRGDSLLDLMFIKDEAHIITAGRGLARTEKLLEVLAGVEGERVPAFDRLARLVTRHREGLTSCVVVLAGWDYLRALFIKDLARSGITCVPIVIGDGQPPADLIGHWIESGHVARDLLKLPRQPRTNF
ncbi:MAG TPA: DUF58 domain-containing protein [Luteolibacter sp.]|nr:DUF58 domain-containing protein [Luteolibacter sp.]